MASPLRKTRRSEAKSPAKSNLLWNGGRYRPRRSRLGLAGFAECQRPVAGQHRPTNLYQAMSAFRRGTPGGGMSDQIGTGSERLPWPDFAKACAIVLVVLFHSRHTTWMVGFSNDEIADRFWQLTTEALTPLRMPIFFLVSGMLAANSISRPWAAVAPKRVWNIAYLYVLWATIYLAVIPAWPSLERTNYELWQQVGMVAVGDTSAWYLWALLAYFLLARATRNVATPLVLGVALILSIVARELPAALHAPPRLILQSGVFFFVGCRLSHLPARIAEGASLARWSLMLPVLAGMLALYHYKVPGINPLVGAVSATWGIMGAALATRHFALLRRWGGWLGARTLPVYVMHFVVLTLLINAATRIPAGLKGSVFIALIAPVLLASATIVICLFLATLLPKARLGWLLTIPTRRFTVLRTHYDDQGPDSPIRA